MSDSAIQFGVMLVFVRLLPMTLLLPGVGGLRLSVLTRVGMAVVLTCLVAPLVVSSTWATWGLADPLSALTESAFRGAAVGGTIRVMVAALAWAGDWISELAGFAERESATNATILGAQSPVGTLHVWLGLLIFWAIGGVSMAVDATLHSFQALPLAHDPTGWTSWGTLAGGVLQQATELAVRIGSPVCLSLVAAHLALALIQRSLPQWSAAPVQFAGPWIVLWGALLLTIGSHTEFIANHWASALTELASRLGPSP